MKSMEEYRELLLKCTRCGNCQYHCPSYIASRREPLVSRGRLELIRNVLDNKLEYSDLFFKRMNQCLLCGNCSNICPAGIKTEDIIEAARAECIKKKGVSGPLKAVEENVEKDGNITGDASSNRLLWLENLKGKIEPPKQSEPAEYAYLTGCVPALYPSSYSIPQAFVTLLQKAGVDFTLLGESEICCGYPLIIGGLIEQAKRTAEKNIGILHQLNVKYAVTTCPSCYHMWNDLYPELLGRKPDFKIIHGTQLLESLINENRLKLKEVPVKVTYHDPCDLGRKSGHYDTPRNILRRIPGIELVEMKYTKDDSRCCGGGGNLEMHDPELGNRVAAERIRQAMDTGAKTLVSACQQCKRTLQGGARLQRARIKVMDISELVLEALE